MAISPSIWRADEEYSLTDFTKPIPSQRKEDAEAEIAELNDLLAANPNHPHRDQIHQELDYERRLKEMFSKVIPD